MNEIDEQSFGVVPVYLESAAPLYLLVQQHQGHWGFPKGHPENNEDPQETAVREFTEETGIRKLQLDSGFKSVNTYTYTKDDREVSKQTTYFLGVAEEAETNIDGQEILACDWLPYAGARKRLTFDESKQTLAEAKEYLRKRDE